MKKVRFIAWKLVNGKKKDVLDTTRLASKEAVKVVLKEMNIEYDGIDVVR